MIYTIRDSKGNPIHKIENNLNVNCTESLKSIVDIDYRLINIEKEMNMMNKLSTESSTKKSFKDRILEFIDTLKTWFNKFLDFIKTFVKKIKDFFTNKFNELKNKFKNKEIVIESIDVVDNKTPEKTIESEVSTKKLVFIRLKGFLLPKVVKYESLLRTINCDDCIVNTKIDANTELKEQFKNLNFVISETDKIISNQISKEDFDVIKTKFEDIKNNTKPLVLQEQISNDSSNIKLSKKIIFDIFNGFQKKRDSSNFDELDKSVDAYSKIDLKIQNALTDIQTKIKTLGYDENKIPSEFSDKISQLNYARKYISFLYGNIIKYSNKTTKMYGAISVIITTPLSALGLQILREYGFDVNGVVNDKLSKKFKTKFVKFWDGTIKVNIVNAKCNLSKSEAEKFKNMPSTYNHRVFLGERNPYNDVETKDEYASERDENTRLVKEFMNIAVLRVKELAKLFDKNVVIYKFEINKFELNVDNPYIVFSGLANIDYRVKANLPSSITHLYHTSFIGGLTEIRPSKGLSNMAEHNYLGDSSGKIYASVEPVIRNGSKLGAMPLNMIIDLKKRDLINPNDETWKNYSVYEIDISNIDKNNIYLDPEHNYAGVKNKFENNCVYIITDKPIPCKDVSRQFKSAVNKIRGKFNHIE